MNDEEMEEWQEILSNSSFKKPIPNKDIKKAYEAIRNWQDVKTDGHGGYPFIEEAEIQVNGKKYVVVAWGAHCSYDAKESDCNIIFLEKK